MKLITIKLSYSFERTHLVGAYNLGKRFRNTLTIYKR